MNGETLRQMAKFNFLGVDTDAARSMEAMGSLDVGQRVQRFWGTKMGMFE